MQVDSTQEKKFELSDLDEDADIEVMTEPQTKPETTVESAVTPSDHQQNGSSPTSTTSPTTKEGGHDRNDSWSGFLKKKLSPRLNKDTPATPVTETKKRDWTKEQEALARFKTNAATTLSQMQSKLNEGGAYLYEASRRTAQATAENFKKIRLFKNPIEGVCKAEALQKPCPRLLLVCCTFLSSRGISNEEVTRQEGIEELIHAVSAHFLKESGATLPPNGVTAEVVFGVIKKFLMDLDEPLLTYRLAEGWIEGGKDHQKLAEVMELLPPANFNSLQVLLDCMNQVALDSNGPDVDTLAQVLAPCLLWKLTKPPSKRNARAQQTLAKLFSNKNASAETDDTATSDVSSMNDSPGGVQGSDASEFSGRLPLEGPELQAVAEALNFLISNVRAS